MNRIAQVSASAGLSAVEDEARRDGFAFRPGKVVEAAMRERGMAATWPDFAKSWDDLGIDLYMADGGRYRRRRFAAFRVSGDAIVRKPHQPHYQSRDYNPLNGGIERWFDPVLEEVTANGFTQELIGICRHVFDGAAADAAHRSPWHAEMHQFRIETMTGQPGLPTPEGMHRDGVDWVCVMLVGRRNVSRGVTEIHDSKTDTHSRFTLADPLDTVFLDDMRVRHGVTPIEPIDPEEEGFRDVLVLTFRPDG